MDLLELNDIYCKDRARMKKEAIFKEDIEVLYPFKPIEDPVFGGSEDDYINTIVCDPFDGTSSRSFRHSLYDFTLYVTSVPLTSYFDYDLKDLTPPKDRQEMYELYRTQVIHCHPDIQFTDELPGISLAMSALKNTNTYFQKYSESLPEFSGQFVSGNDVYQDDRTMSMIYFCKDGERKYAFGSLIFFGRGLISLPYELQLYLLSNTYIIDKHPMRAYRKNQKGLHKRDWSNMRTSCIVVYEESLERILNNIGEKEE